MSRVLLASANLTREPYPVYPLGMAVVAATLEARGHTVAQFDFLAAGGREEAFAARIADFGPDFVGISLRNLDNCDSLTPTDYPSIARRLVAVAKGCTSAPVILGGPAFSILPGELLAYTGADYGIAGEGEDLAADLVEALAAGRAAPRLQRSACGSGAGVSPRYVPDLVRFYQEQSGLLNVQSKRGCSHACVYCNYADLEGTAYRARDPREVVDDMARAHAEFGVSDFFIVDAVFNDPGGLHMALVDELLRRDLGLGWNCYLRPKHLGAAELRLMKRAGLKAAELGTDAASDTTLRGLGKGFTFDEVVAANEALVSCRIPCAHFVMFGGPLETAATVAEGLANLGRLERTVVFAFSGIRILPGTALHRLALQEGLLAPGAPLLEPVYYHAPGVDRVAMEAAITAAFRGRRDRFYPPERGRSRMEVLHDFGLRGLVWNTLIRYPQAPEAMEPSPC